MQILWQIRRRFVRDRENAGTKAVYNTVSTIVRILEKKFLAQDKTQKVNRTVNT